MTLESALSSRRTTREYSAETPTIGELGQILWAAQGVTDELGHRTAPSAGGSYPLRIYLAVRDVPGLPTGLYVYLPTTHALELRSEGDCRTRVIAAVGQAWVAAAPALITVCADFADTRGKYGEKGVQHVYVEAGAVVQNIYLQCAALGLVTGFAGGFDDARLRTALAAPDWETPMGVMPIGRAP